ncbi:MAG: NAD-dependent epimerase [Ferruginibacter sp.]
MRILVTGSAGFIGFHLANQLIKEGFEVVGLDSINDYYQVSLKYDRLTAAGIPAGDIAYNRLVKSSTMPGYSFIQLKLEDKENLDQLFTTQEFDVVVNLAAQAGVRYSLANPSAYIESNIVGFANLLECSRNFKIKHFVYASSSSVYGLNEDIPFATRQTVDHPISLYAATKKSNELMAHVYSHLYGLATTGLRFFTVYGPWGRPDMAMFLFTKAIIDGKPIQVFNNGEMERDFTYIDDIVDGVIRVVKNPATGNTEWSGLEPDPPTSRAPYQLYNIGNSAPVKLTAFIDAIEHKLGKTAEKILMPMQPGDVHKTYADITDLKTNLGYQPSTSIQEGVSNFIDWYFDYFKVLAS